MLIPQFSLRSMFVLTAVVAVLALVTTWGGQGVAWAVGVTAALVALTLVVLAHVGLFALVWIFSLGGRRDKQIPPATSAPAEVATPAGPT